MTPEDARPEAADGAEAARAAEAAEAAEEEALLQEFIAQMSGVPLPHHVAIIMDGNGRWARQRGLSRVQGHFAGRRATKRIVRACTKIDLDVLSLYAFSAENWRRSNDEVDALLHLISLALAEEIEEMGTENIRVVASGRLDETPDYLRQVFEEGEKSTAGNTGLTLNLCVNYGGRAEIVDAARALAREAAAGELEPTAIDEELFDGHLYHPELGDVDLLVRPGGESRLSNYLLWQVAYAEVIMSPVLWPDFTEALLGEALLEYSRRNRRFGGTPDTDADTD